MTWARERRWLARECPQRATDMWMDWEGGRTILLSDSRLALQRFDLDEIGAAVWRMCDGNTRLDEICARIAVEFDHEGISCDEIGRDIERLLQSLSKEQLIDWIPLDRCVDVLLVQPPAPSVYALDAVNTTEFSSVPLGQCYIAAVLRAQGVSVAILDLHQAGGRPEDVVAACRRLMPRVVGVSATTPSFPNAARVARFVKALSPSIVTIVGGAHASALPTECLTAGGFDYVCVGEGEYAMAEFVQAVFNGRDASQVPGIGTMTAMGYKFSCSRPFIHNLDDLPFPARDIVDISRYLRRGGVISARGCPIGCVFCSCPSVVGQQYRVHGLDRVMTEIDECRRAYGITKIDLHDDTFNLSASRVRDFCTRMTAELNDIEWGCFCRARQFSDEQARQMVRGGCRVVQFGVESGSNNILKAIGKKTELSDVERAVRAASKAGIDQIVCGFIIGHPQDTEESMKETIEFAEHLAKLGATRLTLSLLTPYPGTAVFDQRDELGITMMSDNWEDYTFSRIVQHGPKFSAERLRTLYVDGLLRFMDATSR